MPTTTLTLILDSPTTTITVESEAPTRKEAIGRAIELLIAAYEKEKSRKEASADAGI